MRYLYSGLWWSAFGRRQRRDQSSRAMEKKGAVVHAAGVNGLNEMLLHTSPACAIMTPGTWTPHPILTPGMMPCTADGVEDSKLRV